MVSTSAWHAVDLGSIPRPGMLFGVKTWLFTWETVYLSRLDDHVNVDVTTMSA